MASRSPKLRIDQLTSSRHGFARYAALRLGVFSAGVLGWTLAADRGDPRSLAVSAALFGVLGAAAGVVAVYTGAAWRAGDGRWHVRRTFAALAVGPPVAALAGFLALGEPRGPSALLAPAVWIVVVAAASVAVRFRRGVDSARA
jgi:hypothetical protein